MISENEISAIDGMEGHEFEYFCANLLRMVGFYDVKVTPGSGDQGVDVLAEKDGIKYAIQCKNYASALSNTPVQEVSAGKQYYGCHVGVVMTNSTFTPGAVQLAKANNILLWDRQKLSQLISQAGGLAKLGIDLDDDFEDEFDDVDSEDDDTIMSYGFEKQDYVNYVGEINAKANYKKRKNKSGTIILIILIAIIFSFILINAQNNDNQENNQQTTSSINNKQNNDNQENNQQTISSINNKQNTSSNFQSNDTSQSSPHKHTFSSWEFYNGTSHYRKCTSCSEEEHEEHEIDDGVITQVASCDKEGTITFTCLKCKAEGYESIPKSEHTWSNGKVTRQASCNQTGEKTYTCSICSKTKKEVIPKTTTHSWNNGKTTQNPTCTQEGIITYSCTVCNTEKTESIDKISHKYDQSINTSAYLKTKATYTKGSIYYFSCICGAKGTETFTENDKLEWINAETLRQLFDYTATWMGEYIWLSKYDFVENKRYEYNIYGSPTSKMETGIIYEGNCEGLLIRFKNEKSNTVSSGLFFYYDDLVKLGIVN